MKNTVRKRLTLSYVLLTLLMAALATYSVINLRQLQAGSEQILQEHQPVLADMAAVVNNVLFHSLKVNQYIATDSEAHLRSVRKLERRVETHLSSLEYRTRGDRDLALVKKIREAFDTYTDLSGELRTFFTVFPDDKKRISAKQVLIAALLENALLEKAHVLYRKKQEQTRLLVAANQRLGRAHLWSAILMGVAFTVLAILQGFFISRSIVQPIAGLMASTRRLADGELSARVRLKAADEIGVLGDAFNSMAGRMQEMVETLDHRVAERTRQLADERNFVSTILDTVGALVTVFRGDGRIVRFNKACERATGRRFSEVESKRIRDLFLSPDQKDPLETYFEDPDSRRIPERYENFWKTEEGDQRLIRWSNAVLRDEKEQIEYVVATGIDISKQRRAEEELLKARKLESVGELAGGIAHDFNNLLTVILGNLCLLEEDVETGSDMASFIAAIEKAAMNARDLTQQLITFSQGGKPVRKITSVEEPLKEAVRFNLSGSAVACEFEISRDARLVKLDNAQFRQAIGNIVSNAAAAMPDGGAISVKVENVVIDEEHEAPLAGVSMGDYVMISIRDRGVGIPPEHISKIFDPFFSTKERGSQKGMGLGLSTAYSIIRGHGGHISVESEEGVGTVFCIYLKAVGEKRAGAGDKSRGDSERDRKIRKVLLMDDEPMLRQLAEQILNRLGYIAETARDGSEAIALYEKAKASGEPFDVVILDLTIKGGMGGMETLKHLTAIEPDVRAIVSSGYSSDPAMANFSDHGFVDVIPKPFRMKNVQDVLERIQAK
ncbi:MAG: response regulator [Desulfobacterales bacterium]|nr:response regulator [Desulfobacterales bacterium]